MNSKNDLVLLINEVINDKSCWNSNLLIAISRKLQKVEEETGESYSDFHRKLGHTNVNNENEHRAFQELLRSIKQSLI